jgi:hypothetical protein
MIVEYPPGAICCLVNDSDNDQAATGIAMPAQHSPASATNFIRIKLPL